MRYFNVLSLLMIFLISIQFSFLNDLTRFLWMCLWINGNHINICASFESASLDAMTCFINLTCEYLIVNYNFYKSLIVNLSLNPSWVCCKLQISSPATTHSSCIDCVCFSKPVVLPRVFLCLVASGGRWQTFTVLLRRILVVPPDGVGWSMTSSGRRQWTFTFLFTETMVVHISDGGLRRWWWLIVMLELRCGLLLYYSGWRQSNTDMPKHTDIRLFLLLLFSWNCHMIFCKKDQDSLKVDFQHDRVF